MDGIINILKPPGMTSHDVVAFIRRRLCLKKVGHTGTLDPNATGVLPICLGKATRLTEYLQDTNKEYRALLHLGISTDTQDADGQILRSVPMPDVQAEDVLRVFRQFIGQISQIPPMYSAVKKNGQKLYELARKGKTVDREARKVHIFSLSLRKFFSDRDGFPSFIFDVICSKGTYIRTLCTDIGQSLGGNGHLAFLVRTMSGPFSITTALTLEDFADCLASGKLNEAVLPLDYPLTPLPACRLDEAAAAAVRHGRSISDNVVSASVGSTGLVRLYTESGEFLAVGQRMPNGTIRPDKVFV
ncbi:MAG: tRNA pseudouridine(55) synthase TruB [bacterium]|jgi:tRNA pseudouridine55 synthase